MASRSILATIQQSGILGPAPPSPMNSCRFNIGDRVTLISENPYKGTLKSGQAYTITDILLSYPNNNQVELEVPGRNASWFMEKWFKPFDEAKANLDMAAEEYSDAMAALEIMEREKVK